MLENITLESLGDLPEDLHVITEDLRYDSRFD